MKEEVHYVLLLLLLLLLLLPPLAAEHLLSQLPVDVQSFALLALSAAVECLLGLLSCAVEHAGT